MATSKDKATNPVMDQAVMESHARSVQLPQQGRILREDTTGTSLAYIDMSAFAGKMVEILSNQEMYIVCVFANPPSTVPTVNDHVDGSTWEAIDEDVMSRYPAEYPVWGIVHPDRPFLAYITAADGWLQITRR